MRLDACPAHGWARAQASEANDIETLLFNTVGYVAVSAPLVTTNALDCTIAGSLPGLGASVVFGRDPTAAEGRVRTGRAPIVRFGIR